MTSVPSLESLFFECLQKNTPEERAAYLAHACAGDAELLRRLRKMLEAHGSSFLEQAAYLHEATVESPVPSERPGQRIGAYRLVEQVGEGGMGSVWRAAQLEPVQRQVALKLIKAGMDSRQVIARFEAERQALALMDHPNIARVLDGGADAAGRPYFVMDLFAGVPITRFCDDRRLPVRQRLELFVQVCEAIQHAHQKGVIHRDIKPSNVLVALQDGRAVPKVIDFGIAKAIGQELTEGTVLTQQGGLVGTLEYMSPEQSARVPGGVDTRSDIYSLGVLLYELLTGSTPLSRRLLEQASLADLLRVIADDETPKPSTRLREDGAATAAVAAQRGVESARLANLVSGELDWIVMKALEKDRDRRYATSADLAQDVRRFLADEPVLAGPPSAVYRFRKFARRRRGALAAASALAAALLIAIGGVGWAMRDRAARTAEAERVAADRGARVLATVQDLLAAADREMSAQAWSEALATVRRADAAATSGEADAATTRRVRVLLRDLEFVDRLDRLRSRQATWSSSGFDGAAAVREYAEAFQEHGIDIESSSVEVIAERLRTTPALAVPLAAGLDHFARRRLDVKGGLAACRQLELVANAVDPDPVRASIRTAWTDLEAAGELQRLADSIDVRRQQPATLINLAQALRLEQPAAAKRLMLDAQRAHPGDFWLAFDLGVALTREGDFEGALLYNTAAVAIRPESAAAHCNLGHVLRIKGDVQAAIASFERAIELDPTLSMPHTNMGRAMLDLRRPDEALASMRRALELDPRSAMAWIGLGTVLRDTNHPGEAGDAFARAIELEPANGHAHAGASDVLRGLGKLPEAIAAAREAVSVDPGCAGGHISLGNALAEMRDWAASAESYRKATELEPRNAVAVGNLGSLLSAAGDPSRRDEAVALCRKAVELDPFYAVGHLGLGNALYRAGQQEAAIASYRMAADIDPTLAAAHFNLGQMLLNLRPDEALTAYRRAIELRPNYGDAYHGIALVHRGRNELDHAEAALRMALGMEPGNARAHHTLAGILNDLGRHDEALAVYRRAAEIEPGNPSRHTALGHALCDAQRYDEAASAGRKAIEADPSSGAAYQLLGRVLWIQGQFAAAIDALEEAIRLLPRDASAAGDLASLLATCPDASLRDADRAVELAKKAVELEPGNAGHSRVLGAAHYRAGDWQAALDALQLAAERDPDSRGSAWFFAAMAHRRLGNEVEARSSYERGCEWMSRARSDEQDAHALREEAANLLGIEGSSR